MTEENYNYRTSQILLRNQFLGKGKWKIPIIPKFESRENDFRDLLLIGFDKTHIEDNKHLDRMVHFFLYDYRFERVWKSPDNDIEKLKRYRAVLSPDFSMYLEMSPMMQLYNVFRNRWCGAYWASKGMRVIPTVNWGDETTFDFCFSGVEKGSTVAVSTYMASEHGHHKDQKEWFMAGYDEMLRQIEPERIICYNTPFPEMRGNIVFIDYDLSSWRYMQRENKSVYEDMSAYKLDYSAGGICDKMSAYIDVSKGGGSVHGGEWRPAKDEDKRFLGKPNTINTIFDRNGNKKQTKIGPDGRAIMERHYTNHGFPKAHSPVHDHKIDWSRGVPDPSRQINYWDGNIPEFKHFIREANKMETGKIIYSTGDDYAFTSISDFKFSVNHGAEIIIEWNGKRYGIASKVCRYEGAPEQKLISQIEIPEKEMEKSEKWYNTADEVLDYMLGEDKLRDVITQVEVWERTI